MPRAYSASCAAALLAAPSGVVRGEHPRRGDEKHAATTLASLQLQRGEPPWREEQAAVRVGWLLQASSVDPCSAQPKRVQVAVRAG